MPNPPKETYGADKIKAFIQHYGKELQGETIVGDEYARPAFVSSDLPTEWKTFRRYITNQGYKQAAKRIVHKFNVRNYVSRFEYPCKCMFDYSSRNYFRRALIFTKMKMIKTRLRSRLREANLSHLMKITIKSPETLSDEGLEQIIDVWNRKPRRIAV